MTNFDAMTRDDVLEWRASMMATSATNATNLSVSEHILDLYAAIDDPGTMTAADLGRSILRTYRAAAQAVVDAQAWDVSLTAIANEMRRCDVDTIAGLIGG